MFLLRMVQLSRDPQSSRWLFRLSLIPLVVLYAILARIFGWSGWGGVLVAVAELPLLFIIDRIIRAKLHREFRVRFNPFQNPFTPVPRLITQTEVDIFLEAVAWKLKFLTEEQRRTAESNRTLPNGFTHAGMRVINEWVASALEYYWRAHWLARIFGYETRPRWKDYLPSEAA